MTGSKLPVARGLAKSRTRAQAFIPAGRVVVEGVGVPMASALAPEAVRVILKELAPSPPVKETLQ